MTGADQHNGQCTNSCVSASDQTASSSVDMTDCIYAESEGARNCSGLLEEDAYERAARNFATLAPHMTSEHFWLGIHRLWTSFRHANYATYAQLFCRHRRGWRRDFMSEENAAAYDCLPTYVDLFRGQDLDKPLGLAWTLNEGVALYDFAMNLWGDHPSAGVVCARVPKIAIAAVFLRDCQISENGPYESEIVLFEPPVGRYSYRFDSIPNDLGVYLEERIFPGEVIEELTEKHRGLTVEGALELMRLLNPTLHEQAERLMRRRHSLSYGTAFELVCRRQQRAALGRRY